MKLHGGIQPLAAGSTHGGLCATMPGGSTRVGVQPSGGSLGRDGRIVHSKSWWALLALGLCPFAQEMTVRRASV